MTIPVIGAAVVNSSFWITRLLMSVDYPVDNFVIINNNGRGELDDELNALTKIKHKFINKITVSHLPANLGCSGAWNLIIKCYMLAPYWIIVNDDVSFGPGLLKEFAETVEADPTVGIVHAHQGEYGIGSWDLFLIRDHIIRDYGLFDENLYPAYCEDSDYFMRLIHHPINRVMSLNGNYYHGMGDKTQYYEEGTQTQKTDPTLVEKLYHSNNRNIEYLTKKWGPRWRTCWPSEQPFENQPINTTTYDLDFVRSKHLGF